MSGRPSLLLATVSELRGVVRFPQPALEIRVHLAFLRNADTMAHHRIEAAGFFQSGSRWLTLQVNADIDTISC